LAKGEIILIADSNAIIDLIKLAILNSICKLPDYKFLIVMEVYQEIIRPEQREMLNRAIESGLVSLVSLIEIEELQLFSRFSLSLGAGEAASLAYAYCHGTYFLSDENNNAFMREIRNTISEARLKRTLDLLAEAISEKLFSVLSLKKRIKELEAKTVTPRDWNDIEHFRCILLKLENQNG